MSTSTNQFAVGDWVRFKDGPGICRVTQLGYSLMNVNYVSPRGRLMEDTFLKSHCYIDTPSDRELEEFLVAVLEKGD